MHVTICCSEVGCVFVIMLCTPLLFVLVLLMRWGVIM